MPTNYSLPNQGQYTFTDYIGINSADPQHAKRHLFPSILLNGGFQEMPETVDMHEIPVETSGNGFGTPKITMDGFGSGRRRVGMLVHVLAEKKIYKLIPQGFYGNGGNNGLTEWNALTDIQKYELLSPTATYNASYTPPNNYTESTPTGAAGDCWVELEFGSDGNPISAINYTQSTGTLEVVLTHDGTGGGTPISFSKVVDKYESALVDTTTNVPTAVGGFQTSDTVAGLNGMTHSQMWDKLLFPTVNPTGSGAFANLTESYNLLEAQSLINMNLTPTAGRGTLSNPSGNWAGNINDAYITDISSGGATISQQNLTTSPPSTINALTYSNYPVVLGENKFKLWVSFDQGPMPLDSTGADYPGVRYNLANNPKTNTTEFEGVFPIYLGKADGTWEKRGLVSQGANDIQCVQNYAETESLKHKIAVPQVMVQGGDITIELYHPTLGNNPSYPNGVGGAPSVWTKTAGTFTVHANAVDIDYWIYEKTASTGLGNTWIVNW